MALFSLAVMQESSHSGVAQAYEQDEDVKQQVGKCGFSPNIWSRMSRVTTEEGSQLTRVTCHVCS